MIPAESASVEENAAAPAWSPRAVRVTAAIIVAATVVLHLPSIVFPMLMHDDVGVIRESWPGSVLETNLLFPHNEHVMPLSRLLTYALAEAAGSASALPLTMSLVGPAAMLLTLWAIYLFVRREMGHPVYGLFAMALFGLLPIYAQAVYWFCSTFYLIAFLFTVLALLPAQRFRQTGKPLALVWCALLTALAQGWFTIGVFAGPLCALYLLPPAQAGEARSPLWRRLLIAATPLIGTLAFSVICLPQHFEQIMHVGHYKGQTAAESFHLDRAVLHTLQAPVDSLLLTHLGIVYLDPPPIVTYVLLPFVFVGGAVWFRRAEHKRLLLLGLGFIALNYLLIYGARSEWPYETIRTWGRYHVFPHFGLVLFIVGGLSHWEAKWLRAPSTLSGKARWNGVGLLLLLMAVEIPRTLPFLRYDPAQRRELQHIDVIDQRCREHRIGREQALRVLPPVAIPMSNLQHDNCWKLLRGNDHPRDATDAEARQILLPEAKRLFPRLKTTDHEQ